MKMSLLGFLLSASMACMAGDGLCVRHALVPGYPTLGWAARLQGSVVLNIAIAADGEVVSVSPSGAHNLLQEAAAENIRTWRFCASTAEQNATITYVYALEGKETYPKPAAQVVFDFPEQITITSNPPEAQP